MPPKTPPLPLPAPWYHLSHTPTSTPYIALPSSPSSSSTTSSSLPPLFLTPVYPSDAPAMQNNLSGPSVNAALVSVPANYTLAAAEWWLSAPEGAAAQLDLQGIRAGDPETGLLVGSVALRPHGEKGDGTGNGTGDGPCEWELGYYMAEEWQGRGVMRGAVMALLSWVMSEITGRVGSVVVKVVKGNARSRAVVEGIEGWEKEGEEVETWPEEKGGGEVVLDVWRLRV